MHDLYPLLILALSLTSVSAQEDFSDSQILQWYKELRVADVSDGMDMAGLADIGLMENNIMAVWKDIENFDHVIRGIAVTARYIPTNRPRPVFENDDNFRSWEGNWYGQISSEPFVEFLKEGSILVIDANGDGDTGSIGSNNSLLWKSKGMVGIVTTGSLRDSDEVIKQKIPVYMDPLQRGRGIRPGRNEIESVQKTVQVGGVQINPGDVVVADGDGVIVVPRKYAKRVAEAAQIILDGDKNGRRALYKQLGIPLDFTVEEKN
ncbi:MAG: RraA family protein [Saprospiraceae bacterium]|nr:RraA family protein [Saprospiraceae bacterium]